MAIGQIVEDDVVAFTVGDFRDESGQAVLAEEEGEVWIKPGLEE